MNKAYTVIRETERPKHLPGGVVAIMKKEGFTRFGIQSHTDLWKQMDAKNPGKGFGTLVQKTWYWYDTWMDQVRKHCQENEARYKSPTA